MLGCVLLTIIFTLPENPVGYQMARNNSYDYIDFDDELIITAPRYTDAEKDSLGKLYGLNKLSEESIADAEKKQLQTYVNYRNRYLNAFRNLYKYGVVTTIIVFALAWGFIALTKIARHHHLSAAPRRSKRSFLADYYSWKRKLNKP